MPSLSWSSWIVCDVIEIAMAIGNNEKIVADFVIIGAAVAYSAGITQKQVQKKQTPDAFNVKRFTVGSAQREISQFLFEMHLKCVNNWRNETNCEVLKQSALDRECVRGGRDLHNSIRIAHDGRLHQKPRLANKKNTLHSSLMRKYSRYW